MSIGNRLEVIFAQRHHHHHRSSVVRGCRLSATELFRSSSIPPVSGTNYRATSRLHCPLYDFSDSCQKTHLFSRSFPEDFIYSACGVTRIHHHEIANALQHDVSSPRTLARAMYFSGRWLLCSKVYTNCFKRLRQSTGKGVRDMPGPFLNRSD